MLHTKPQGHWPFGSREEAFWKGFYHIWAWQPSWLCDPDAVNKLPFPLSIEDQYEIWLQLAQWFLKRISLNFPYMSLYKKWPLRLIGPSAKIWTILVEVHKIKLYIKYQRPPPSNFRQEEFYSFAYRCLCRKNLTVLLNGSRSTESYYFFQTLLGSWPHCCIPHPRAIGPLVPEKKK